MRFILPLLVVACAPDASVPGFTHDLDDMSAYLVDAPGLAFAERAQRIDAAQGSLLPGGQVMPGEARLRAAKDKLVVVESAGDQLGVIIDKTDWQLVVWLDRQDLATVPVEPTWIGPVRVPAGVPVEPVDHRAGELRVRTSNRVLEVDAWVDERRLDQFWYDDAVADSWAPDPEGEFVQVLPGVMLLDGPLGEPVGRTLDEQWHSLGATLVEERRGHLRVQLVADGWPMDTWVHADDVRRNVTSGFGSFGSSTSCGFGCRFGVVPDVRAGALLHADPEGPVVGRTKQPVHLGVEGGPGEWSTAEVWTEFGNAEVWIAPEDRI